MKNGRRLAAWALGLWMAVGGVACPAQAEAADPAEEVTSMTVEGQIGIRQNGEERVSLTAHYALDGAREYAAATETSHPGGEVLTAELSAEGDSRVLRVGDAYYTMPLNKRLLPADAMARVEAGLDTVRRKFAKSMTETADGCSLRLARGQVPTLLNLAFSMLEIPPLGADGLTLGLDKWIERADLDVTYADGRVSVARIVLVVSGRRKGGVALETEITADLRVTAVNATTPAQVDMSGVEPVRLERFPRDVRALADGPA